MRNENWVWAQVSNLALERTQGDPHAARGKAAGYYKGIYGRWPNYKRKLQPTKDGAVDPNVRRRVKHNLVRWLKSQK